MPIRPDGSHTNRCSTHKNKMIYGSAETVLSVVLRIKEEQGLLLSWYRCEVYNGYHLCKFENKEH
jgi:hypothetical protein